MIEYTILREGQADDLIDAVNQHIKEGWHPHGGYVDAVINGWHHFGQAMIREIKQEFTK